MQKSFFTQAELFSASFQAELEFKTDEAAAGFGTHRRFQTPGQRESSGRFRAAFAECVIPENVR